MNASARQWHAIGNTALCELFRKNNKSEIAQKIIWGIPHPKN